MKLIKEQDDFDWIRDIQPSIELKNNTMYYFVPTLRTNEVGIFANRITNSDYIKNFLLHTVKERELKISYFVIGHDIETILAWSYGLDPYKMEYKYGKRYNFVNAREEFNI